MTKLLVHCGVTDSGHSKCLLSPQTFWSLNIFFFTEQGNKTEMKSQLPDLHRTLNSKKNKNTHNFIEAFWGKWFPRCGSVGTSPMLHNPFLPFSVDLLRILRIMDYEQIWILASTFSYTGFSLPWKHMQTNQSHHNKADTVFVPVWEGMGALSRVGWSSDLAFAGMF